ncbi:hypothetical protein ACFY2R_24640 [Micromonospora olivasterospora]|uniref:Uncharacterized protein n=1 Tax=Micromonospora olivasterospora TaxID=1880 RepID=A0A562I7C3_MICOL|nr:hypothetical protein [Micromonospora olivasterospora]TWH66920.1 hypothetical protein JD77_01881 [Micromonospora olivasterospora]
MENVVEYTYRLNGGPEQTVAAAADGTATVTVTSTQVPAGTPGTFVFGPGMPGVTEHVYSFDGRPAQTVAAGADGAAAVTYTPTTAGLHRVTVYSRTGDGTVSETFSGTYLAARAA